MITLTASFQLLTPAFLGGADHSAQAIRLTALKSALRWWWRALQWAHLDTTDILAARAILWQREMALFGSAAREEGGAMGGGQGAFLMRLKDSKCAPWHPEGENPWAPTENKEDGIAYLLGQGLFAKNKFTRNALRPGTFTVEFLFRPAKAERSSQQIAEDVEQLSQALWLLCHFGGIGARARRGWGSLVFDGSPTLTGLADAPQALGPAESAAQCSAVLGEILSPNQPEKLPPLTAFSSESLIRCVNYSKKKPHQVLSVIGKDFKEARRKMQGQDLEKVENYLRAPADTRVLPARAPCRSVFGLPHNYFLKKTAETVTITPASVSDRRASPLLIHLHRWPNAKLDEYAAIYSLLPADFLPEDEQVQYAAPRKDPHLVSLPVSEVCSLWEPAKTFMAANLRTATSIWPAQTIGKVKP